MVKKLYLFKARRSSRITAILLYLSILIITECMEYLRWQFRNFFNPTYASCSGRRDVGQGNVNIL